MGTWNFAKPSLTDGVKVVYRGCDCKENCDCYNVASQSINNKLRLFKHVNISIDIDVGDAILYVDAEVDVGLINGYYSGVAINLSEVTFNIEVYDKESTYICSGTYLSVDDYNDIEDYEIDEGVVLSKEAQQLVIGLYNYHLNTVVEVSETTGWCTGQYTPDDNGKELLETLSKYDVLYSSDINK